MKYDVAVIGGGPAGIMAAGRAAELGSAVILLEKNNSLGSKLLITGNGRCNFTNKKHNIREFIAQFKEGGKFLFSCLHKFGVEDIIDFFESRGVKAKIEENGKVFPASDKAIDILNVLAERLDELKVEIKYEAVVSKVVKEGENIKKIILAGGAGIIADKYIICTGGKSYPVTGSTGDGYVWAKELGHTIIEPVPALTSIILKDSFVKDLQGLSLSDIQINVSKSNKKLCSCVGDMIFTDNGVSGPAIMDVSRTIAREKTSEISLCVDLFPSDSLLELNVIIQKKFHEDGNKMLKNCLDDLIPPRLALIVLKLAEVDMSKQSNTVKKDEREKIVDILKNFSLTLDGLSGFDRAYISSGGVSLKEVDPSTMKSKIIDNLYFAGEILDLDGPTGGYNLQACWSTGYVAGSEAL